MKPKISYPKAASVLLILMAALTACQPTEPASTDATEPAPTEAAVSPTKAEQTNAINPGILLDPAKTEDPDSQLVSRYLYEGLVRLDENGEVQSGIAQSWVVSDDTLDYIFEIRPNAKFSDGSVITTDIIADNYNRWFDPQSPLHGDGNFPNWLNIFLGFNGQRDADNRAVSPVDGVQKVDSNTFIVHLNRPVPELLEYLAQPAFAILSPSALQDSNYGTSDSAIIASGPYTIVSWTDTGLTLGPNPAYWNPVEDGELSFIWK